MNYNRRYEGQKKVKRILRIWRQAHENATWIDDNLARYMLYTRVPCSCPMCGNPRRHWREKTIQEQREDERMTFELEQVDLD